MTVAIWLGCSTRRRGCHGASEDGHETVPLAFCASSVRGASSLVGARGVERVEHDALVVLIDRLTHVLRVAAGTRPHAFRRLIRVQGDHGLRRVLLW
jgi:hypothetical protein